MSIRRISAAPPVPLPTDSPEAYDAKAFPLAQWWTQVPGEFNGAMDDLEALVATLTSSGFTGTSDASLTIGAGLKEFAASPGSAFVGGQALVVASTANPANRMTGTVVTYDPGTGEMALNVTSTNGAGTFADWTIGLALVADLSGYLEKAGGVLIGLLTLAAGIGLLLPPGAAPVGREDGRTWRETGKLMHRIGAVDFEVALVERAQTLYNKTFVAAVLNALTATGDIQLNGSARGNKTAFAGGAINCALGNYFTGAISSNTTLAFSNVPANSYACTLKINWTGGVITLPAGVKLKDGKALKYVSGVWHFVFSTDDGGATWELAAGPFA